MIYVSLTNLISCGVIISPNVADDEDADVDDDMAMEVQTINSSVTKLDDGGTIYNLKSNHSLVVIYLLLFLGILYFIGGGFKLHKEYSEFDTKHYTCDPKFRIFWHTKYSKKIH